MRRKKIQEEKEMNQFNQQAKNSSRKWFGTANNEKQVNDQISSGLKGRA